MYKKIIFIAITSFTVFFVAIILYRYWIFNGKDINSVNQTEKNQKIKVTQRVLSPIIVNDIFPEVYPTTMITVTKEYQLTSGKRVNVSFPEDMEPLENDAIEELIQKYSNSK